jgi:uncharacterized protein YkwD
MLNNMRKRYAIVGMIIILAVAASIALLTRPTTKTRQVTATSHKAQTATPAFAINPKPPTKQEFLDLTNKARVENGLQPLIEDPLLDASAQRKADEEVAQHYADHVNPTTGVHGYEYAHEAMPECRHTSENLAHNNSDFTNTASHTVQGLLHSPPHRAAILNPDNVYVGFGINGYEIVEHFCAIR